jgi:hypothetical protein
MAGGPAPALQVLVCPVTDANLDIPSSLVPENQMVLTLELRPVLEPLGCGCREPCHGV